MTSTEITVPDQLLDPRTGELHPATADVAVEFLTAAREWRDRLLGLIKDCEAVLIEESRQQGKGTLHLAGGTAIVERKDELVWDLDVLEGLRELGLPDDRYDELVETVVTYKVRANVAKQIAGANEQYAEIVDKALTRVEKTPRVTVK